MVSERDAGPDIEPNQPLDLNQLVMQLLKGVGKGLEVDNRILAVTDRVLLTWVKDGKTRKELIRLPQRMSVNEARYRQRKENRGMLFPMVQELIESHDGTLNKIIERDYYYKLVEVIGPKLYDLKKQGILNWGVDVGGEVPGVYLGNIQKKRR
jgi:hypothetical protein